MILEGLGVRQRLNAMNMVGLVLSFATVYESQFSHM